MKLPERKFYTVSELAERWGVDSSTVLEMLVMGQLLPSLFIDDVSCCFYDNDMSVMNYKSVSGEIYFTAPHSVLVRDRFTLHCGLFVCNYLLPDGFGEDAFGPTPDEIEAAAGIFFAEPQTFFVSDIRVRQGLLKQAEQRLGIEKVLADNEPKDALRDLEHLTPEIQLMIEAQKKFWNHDRVDRHDPSTWPRKPAVIDWFQTRLGPKTEVRSKQLANSISPLWARTPGRR